MVFSWSVTGAAASAALAEVGGEAARVAEETDRFGSVGDGEAFVEADEVAPDPVRDGDDPVLRVDSAVAGNIEAGAGALRYADAQGGPPVR
jgi:hypothetical protein